LSHLFDINSKKLAAREPILLQVKKNPGMIGVYGIKMSHSDDSGCNV
jgi:hypothetical protein